MSTKRLTEFFGLPNLKHLKTHYQQSKRFMELHFEHLDHQNCPHCSSNLVKTHQWRIRKVKDSPIRGRIPILFIKHRRMKCLNCNKTYTEKIQGLNKHARITQRLQREILYACENFKDHKRVRKHTTCGSKTIYDRCYKELRKKQAERQNNPWPKVVGIDEHAFTKNKQLGHREFVTLIVDHDNKRPKELVPGRVGSILHQSLAYIPGRERVEYVTMDLSATYRSFAKSFFPNAKIVADHFHVVRLLHPAINRRRKAITGDERKNPIRKLLLKKATSLELFKRKAIERWLKDHPELEAIYVAKEWLHKLYRCRGYKKARKCFINLTDWLALQNVKELKTLRKTLRKWRDEILMFFKKRITNARTEGFNNVAKSIIKNAYGFKNVENYRLKILNVRSSS